MDAGEQRLTRTLDTAVSTTEALCQLPAVATLDWGDQAAAAIAGVSGSGWAAIMIGSIDAEGRITNHEATGIGHARADDEQSRSVELSLRSRAERLTDTGIRRGDIGTEDQPRTHTLSGIWGPDAWRGRGLGQMWAEAPVLDVLVATSPLGDVEPGRVLIVMIGVCSPMHGVSAEQVAVVKGIMPLLIRRTLLAVGPKRSTSARWLTVREQEVLEQLTLGKSVRQIAEEMDRSPHTIHDHVKSLHRKLNASSRGELVARALGFIDEGARIRDSGKPARETHLPEIATTRAVTTEHEPKLTLRRDEHDDAIPSVVVREAQHARQPNQG